MNTNFQEFFNMFYWVTPDTLVLLPDLSKKFINFAPTRTIYRHFIKNTTSFMYISYFYLHTALCSSSFIYSTRIFVVNHMFSHFSFVVSRQIESGHLANIYQYINSFSIDLHFLKIELCVNIQLFMAWTHFFNADNFIKYVMSFFFYFFIFHYVVKLC